MVYIDFIINSGDKIKTYTKKLKSLLNFMVYGLGGTWALKLQSHKTIWTF